MGNGGELAARLRWVLMPGLSHKLFYELLLRAGTARRIWELPAQELEERGIPTAAIQRIRAARPAMPPEQVLDASRAQGLACVTLEDPRYPALLRRERYPPPVPWIRRGVGREDQAAVAVVGTRRPSPTDCALARETGARLARMGFTVVRGLATGIDGVAHRAALEAGGRTLAVLAGGLDRITPSLGPTAPWPARWPAPVP